MHVLDWVESPTFLGDVRQLIASTGITIAEDAPFRPASRGDSRESTLVGAEDPFLSESEVRELRDWWLVHRRGAKLPTWDLALAGRSADNERAVVLFEAKAHRTELSVAGKEAPTRNTDDGKERSEANHQRIGEAIAEVSAALGISICRDRNYQFANRVAFAWKIASMGVPVALVYLGFIGDDQISPGNQFSDEAAWQAAFREHVADCFPPSMLEAAVATSRAPFWLLPRSLHVIRPSQPRERRRGLGASEPLHLIGPLCGRLAEVERRLRHAHDYLAERGASALQRAAGISARAGWGCSVKRERVTLPAEGKPSDIPRGVTSHSLAEIINQCATVERLLDVIAWAQTESSGLSSFDVQCCHPTTSSVTERENSEHDLVLIGPASEARFEVSDVASSEDGNQKERKDLMRLGVLGADGTPSLEAEPRKLGRCFLVVSDEFAGGICERWPAWRRAGSLSYFVIDLPTGSTKLLEILRGPAQPLDPGYSQTVFIATQPVNGWPESWGIITAYNPPGVARSLAENEAANAQLQSTLAEWTHFPVTGASPDLSHREPGYGVEAPLMRLLELGRRFDQAAIFWVKRGVVFLYPCQPTSPPVRIGKWHDRLRIESRCSS
jgi:hypothetical protein